jgi:NAD(P)H-hydrate repair Nnr-like enzyme with NAD(P)H-hydrate dehydratase domain
MGEAVIAVRVCLRSGVGILTVSIPEEERFILKTSIFEATLKAREDVVKNINDFSVNGIGSGIRTSKNETELVHQVILTCIKPLLLDADALNLIS